MNKENKMIKGAKKGIPITIVGLEYAGKTTLLRWIKEKKFRRPKTTVGFNFDQLEINGLLFNVFDLSGQKKFRKEIWKYHIQSSVGIIFVLDSSDAKKMQESKKWFWKIIDDWLEEIFSDSVVLFMANKSDLKKSKELDKIIDHFNLQKMARYSHISFQIFKTSIRKNNNIDYALNWFVSKINKIIETQTINIESITIADKYGNLIYIYDPNNIASDSDLFSGFLKAMSSFSDEILGAEQLKMVKFEPYFILISKYERYYISIITKEESSLPEIRRIIHRIYQEIISCETEDLSKGDLKNIVDRFIDR